ncbi:chemotaxis protein CheW [Haloarcula brevis]|uniref:chemotaxis protein CheW n=1 Tax=Haloarcula brevis TaxID=3111453 RepID=UPI00300EA6C5
MSTTGTSRNATPDEQVLTFTLGDERYCLGIEYVVELADSEEMTSLPNTEEFVEDIMELRGRTTTIINPTKILETDRKDLFTDGGNSEHRIVVLDGEGIDTVSSVGWVVSEVF